MAHSFRSDARALTDVPDTVSALIAQRLRWDRGLITIWSRKYVGALDPRQSSFRLKDAIALMDVIGFQIVLALAFPVYIVWLIYYFGDFSPILIGATLAGYVVLDAVSFCGRGRGSNRSCRCACSRICLSTRSCRFRLCALFASWRSYRS